MLYVDMPSDIVCLEKILNMQDGFKDDSLRMMKDIERSNAQCQVCLNNVLLFSATFNDTVKNFVARVVKDYNQLFVKKEELSLESVKQYKVKCPDELSKGALKQEDRDKIVKEFKDGLTQVLISTDVLARGFDQQQVNLVINYDLPVKHNTTEPDCEVYLHRIGRAGRFGRKGAVFNLLMDDKDYMLMEKIERHFGSQISEVPSWNSVEDFKAALKAAGLL
ncbi:hypothetical protein Patl1_32298 [Pistacia atlantica]|uniref:Uncharacterized protein n=1 Tax=Pistacia atlantica TaxID=434234 RepID=A0ACC1ALY1_9ROSI|nr:hypothetical protein Patl1_32298 [Pistacia atlantica]